MPQGIAACCCLAIAGLVVAARWAVETEAVDVVARRAAGEESLLVVGR